MLRFRACSPTACLAVLASIAPRARVCSFFFSASITGNTEISSELVKGRQFEISLAELNKNEEDSYRKFSFRIEDVQNNNCLTTFCGMNFTTDKLRSLVRKWQSLIEAHVEVKTTDGFVVRLFAIGFTKKARGQVRKTSYAQAAQLREIRKNMVEIMKKNAQECDLKELVRRLSVICLACCA